MSNIVRGYNIKVDDVADLQLLADHDRRSVSFLVRDAIAAFLKSRRDDLQRLKNSNPEGKVQP